MLSWLLVLSTHASWGSGACPVIQRLKAAWNLAFSELNKNHQVLVSWKSRAGTPLLRWNDCPTQNLPNEGLSQNNVVDITWPCCAAWGTSGGGSMWIPWLRKKAMNPALHMLSCRVPWQDTKKFFRFKKESVCGAWPTRVKKSLLRGKAAAVPEQGEQASHSQASCLGLSRFR